VYVRRAVRRRGAAEVELSTARSQRLQVNGRRAARRDNAKVSWAGSGRRRGSWLGCGRVGRDRGVADTSHGASKEGSGDEDRLHGDSCVVLLKRQGKNFSKRLRMYKS
jgi:hypothetical protein